MEVLQRTANRGSISTGSYEIDNSLKLERANSEQVRATGTTDSGNRKTWTFSTWIKRTEISYNGGFGINALFYAASTGMQINSNDKISIRMYTGSAYTGDLLTTQVFRDTSAWYHIVWTLDTTQSTSSDRIKLWINGQQVTNFDTETYPGLNDEFQIGEAGAASPIRIGNGYWGSSPFSAYIAETHYLNGTAKQASDFGEYDADSGIWIPKEYTDGGYGDIGFYYKFDNASSLGEDSSGEGHDANGLVNVTSADQATDTPTNNFCTFNPLVRVNNNPTISEGGMKVTGGGGTWNQAFGTIGVANGKWYFEVKVADASDTGYFGLSTFPAIPDNVSSGQLMYNTSFMVGASSGIDYYYWQSGSQTSNESTGWGNLSNGDVLGFAIDLDSSTRTCKVYKNNTALSGTAANPFDLPTNMQTEFLFPMYVQYEQNLDYWRFGGWTENVPDSAASDANGYGTFEYAPPSGYYALCSKNLAEFG
jgi:hypothetical protein